MHVAPAVLTINRGAQVRSKQNNCEHSRYDLVVAPFSCSKNGSIVSLPHRQCTLGLELPVDDPAICITSDQTSILAQEMHAVYLRGMATENIAGLSWWQS